MINVASSRLKNISLSIIKYTLYWPLWWYSRGFLIVLKAAGKKIAQAWQGLALGVWLKNIFRPMYGMSDLASRIISFFMRLFQIIFRFIIFIFLTVFILLLPIVYLAAPIVAAWQLLI